MVTPTAEISFQGAIAHTEALLAQHQAGTLTATAWGEAIAALVASRDGARGFFVAYLTSESPLADHPEAEVIEALAAAPPIVPELLVKNLAMSAASELGHQRANNDAAAAGSARTCDRSGRLLVALLSRSGEAIATTVRSHLKALGESLQTGQGEWGAFLDRWGYDEAQRRRIAEAIARL